MRKVRAKGRTKRVVPMTAPLHSALKKMSTVRVGYVIRNLNGTPKSDQQPRSARSASANAPLFRRTVGTICATRSGRTPPCSA